MCFSDLMSELERRGVEATESQVRWAIRAGKVSKPTINGSLRYEFDDGNVAELVTYLRRRQETAV
jgi:hypothetical protein